ncbi:TPA: DoxX family membrane protein [Escherichia coli]
MNTLRYFDFGAARPVLLLIARIAVVLIFIIFGFPKMMGFDGTVQYMASLGAFLLLAITGPGAISLDRR